MYHKNYPEHDINVVFEMIAESLSHGDCHESAVSEMHFINRLFAALPAEAVEYGMRFLHGHTELPSSCDDIMPLYVRFSNLVEYSDKIDFLRDIPHAPTNEQILYRSEILSSLDDHEKVFGNDLLGYRMNAPLPENGMDPTAFPSDESDQAGHEDSSSLHLMNAAAQVLPCKDPLRTSLFYETRLGFSASHLDDESMPHIKLTRDNLSLILVEADGDITRPFHELSDIKYDLYIYASEPLLLYREITGKGVNIIEELADAKEAVKQMTNRQFVFEDNDGRYICVSQLIENIL
ncbi:MAG: hypothetical protein J5786_03475 [Clostridiales bacterium]|nr:hypothetical protein [Clostridiales bacterium]